VRRLLDLRPAVAFPGHGRAMTSPRLAHDLNLLAEHFDEIALPAQGRYVEQAVRANAGGVTSMPPADRERGPGVYLAGSFVAGFAAAVAMQVVRNMSRKRQHETERARQREERFRREAPVSYHVFKTAERAKDATVRAGRRVKDWWAEMTS
jgi:hypothetical protein